MNSMSCGMTLGSHSGTPADVSSRDISLASFGTCSDDIEPAATPLSYHDFPLIYSTFTADAS